MTQSERGSVAGVRGISADCHDDVNDSAEPIEPRLVTRLRDRATVLTDRVTRCGSALKQVISPMSEGPVEIPALFETYENVCHAFDVPDDLKPKLLLPFLCKKARSFVARLPIVQVDDYEYVKDFIVNQCRLTARQYRARFEQGEKRFDETCIIFAARLGNNFRYYLRSREVNDDFERLCELIMSDKLRSYLPQGQLNYVLAAEAGSWHSPDKVAELADTYVANRASVQNSKFVGEQTFQFHHVAQAKTGSHLRRKINSENVRVQVLVRTVVKVVHRGQTSGDVFCCNNTGHIARF